MRTTRAILELVPNVPAFREVPPRPRAAPRRMYHGRVRAYSRTCICATPRLVYDGSTWAADALSAAQTLLFIRAWAKQRAVYGPMMGFGGGVTWAILVATTCKEMPG